MTPVVLGMLAGLLVKAGFLYFGSKTCFGFEIVAAAAVASFLTKREKN